MDDERDDERSDAKEMPEGAPPSSQPANPEGSPSEEAPAPQVASEEGESGTDVGEQDQDASVSAEVGAAAGEPELELPADEGSVEEFDDGTIRPEETRAIVEALVFAAPQPLTPREIGRVLSQPKEEWQPALEALKEEYSRDGRGLQLIEVAGGWQITTRPEYNDWVRELLDPKTPTRLSIQALETLSVIAYRQPVTLPEIIELRGVRSQGVVKTLLEKRLIRITGRKEVVGRPMLYGTTKQFLLHFGLKDLNELPQIEEFAEVLGEEVDIPGLKRAIEAPKPAEVPLSEGEREQGTLFDEASDEEDAPPADEDESPAEESDAQEREGAAGDPEPDDLDDSGTSPEEEDIRPPGDDGAPSGEPKP